MKHFAFAMAMAVAFPAAAQATGPADPAAPVTPPAYRSAFQGVPAGVEEEQLDWKQANADVAQFARGHADYVKWEQQQAGAGQAPAASAPAAAPAATPAPPAAPARTQGHRHH